MNYQYLLHSDKTQFFLKKTLTLYERFKISSININSKQSKISCFQLVVFSKFHFLKRFRRVAVLK